MENSILDIVIGIFGIALLMLLLRKEHKFLIKLYKNKRRSNRMHPVLACEGMFKMFISSRVIANYFKDIEIVSWNCINNDFIFMSENKKYQFFFKIAKIYEVDDLGEYCDCIETIVINSKIESILETNRHKLRCVEMSK